MSKSNLTAERLRELLSYDPETGLFVRRVALSRRSRVGDVVGSRHLKGYLYICVDGERHRAQRLAWLHAHGEWPKGVVDHRNGVPDDNRLINLRDTTQAKNVLNQRRASDFKGVHFRGDVKRWRALIQIEGQSKHLGYFVSEQEARAAYLAAKRQHHPEAGL